MLNRKGADVLNNSGADRSIGKEQAKIIQEFSVFEDDWMQMYQHIVALGKEMPSMDSRYKTEENLIRGCQSGVWIRTYLNNERLHFQVDSDAYIVKGIAALLVRVLSGHSPEEIQTADLYFLDEIGLQEHLSPLRQNGLHSLVKEMKASAEKQNKTPLEESKKKEN